MIKILYSADWHLDSPIQGRTPAHTALLKEALLRIPEKIVALCKQENCDMLLLSGDIFDSEYMQRSYLLVYNALKEAAVPVFITPGNHDFYSINSPWAKELWPENVHIFTQPQLQRVSVESPRCTVYGAAYV